ATLYASLLFGGLFLWVSAPEWPSSQAPEPGLVMPLLGAAALGVVLISSLKAVRAAGRASIGWLIATAAAHALAALIFGWLAFYGAPDRNVHALSATVFAVFCYAAFHSLLGIVFALYGTSRVWTGYVSARRSLDLQIGGYFHVYASAAGIVAVIFTWL